MNLLLWLIGLLLAAAWGVLWWRFGTPGPGAGAVTPPALTGNHPSLATRHYRLGDFRPAPAGVSPPTNHSPAASLPGAAAPGVTNTPDPAAAAAAPAAPGGPAPGSPDYAGEAAAPVPGALPAGALHNYLSAPAPTANDEHNRGVELTAAERRAKMRGVVSQAVSNRQAAA